MTDAPHIPHMTAEQAERISAWHERAYAAARAEAGVDGQTFSHLGLTLRVPPDVQPITGTSSMLGEAILAETGVADRVLDMGCGSGVNGLLAATRTPHVVAVDISPHAVAATLDNATRNGAAGRIDVRQSDVFGAIGAAEVFDLIIFDPPYRWFAARDWLERASTDPDYHALQAFFAGASDHLAPGGRMLISFGSSGDIDYLHALMDSTGFDREVLAQDGMVRDAHRVDYFVYRVTRRA